jgi:hypothetical protein
MQHGSSVTCKHRDLDHHWAESHFLERMRRNGYIGGRRLMRYIKRQSARMNRRRGKSEVSVWMTEAF